MAGLNKFLSGACISMVIIMAIPVIFHGKVECTISCYSYQYTTLTQCVELSNPSRYGETIIYLQGNDIRVIPAYVFQNFTQLTSLHLDNNKIDNAGLEDYAFSGLAVLDYLNLYRNELSSLRRLVHHDMWEWFKVQSNTFV